MNDSIETPACFVENFSLTPCFSRVLNAYAGKNRLNGFSFSLPASTALKHGVNETRFLQSNAGTVSRITEICVFRQKFVSTNNNQ